MGYIKDAAYSLIAYAKKLNLSVALIGFSSNAWIIANESKDYLKHARQVFILKPLGTTNLGNAVQLTARLRPDRALIALLTDGYVAPEDLLQLSEQTQANKVIAAIVSVEARGVENMKAVSKRADLFEVRPDKTGKTIISMLPKST